MPLEIQLLGPPGIRLDGRRIEGLPVKLEALLYFLAVAARPVTRSNLAGLLWGERPEQDARMNLRAALAKLPAALAPHVSIHRDWLAIEKVEGAQVDLTELERCVAALAAGGVQPLDALAAALALYRDDFLAGFSAGNAPEFEAWSAGERTRVRQSALRLANEVLRLQREAGHDDDVVATARRILALSPGNDAALQELMHALARRGQRNAAVEEFERHRRAWREELGIAPSTESLKLAERLVSADATSAAAPAPAAPPTAATSAPLVGRDRELGIAQALLAGESGRIVTLAGLGGIGKTRIAQALVAAMRPAFADGSVVVALGAMRSSAGLAPAIAAALGLQLRGAGPVAKQLQDFLREKSLLLVLDSFEQVLDADAVGLLLGIVQAASGVRLLVTSREALGVDEEVLVSIEGLAYPPADAPLATARSYPAVQLFIQRAARGFVLFDVERELPGVVDICRRVQGIPLAIELAASLARNLPSQEIARAIQRDLATLARDDTSLSPRHRSLAGVLACAWNSLSSPLQAELARLAAFEGPFRTEAAEQVAGCSLRQLSMLIEKSWLRRDPALGYVLHDVIRQFVRGRWVALGVDARSLSQLHAAHFTEWLSECRVPLQRGDAPELVDAIGATLADAIAACEWALANQADAKLEAALDTLYAYYETRGDYTSVERTFGRAREIAEANGAAGPTLRAIVAKNYAWGLVQLSSYDAAMPLLAAALESARTGNSTAAESMALRGMALVRIMQGRAAEARPLVQECLATALRGNDIAERLAALNISGVAANYLSDDECQADAYSRMLEMAREHGMSKACMVAEFNMGCACESRGDWVAAERHFRESLQLGQRLRNDRNTAMSLINIAAAVQKGGDSAQTRALLGEAAEIARRLGDRRILASIFQGLAETAAGEGAWHEADEYAIRVVEVADAIGWSWSALFGLALEAEAAVQLGDVDRARARIVSLAGRAGGMDFDVHHASAAVEAARWMLAFVGSEAALARDALQAIAAMPGLDSWPRDRALALCGSLGIAASDPAAAPSREWMDRLGEALRAAKPKEKAASDWHR